MRKKFLAQQKILKYLAYAIGEIFLVVIGILIALQFNNRNETRKNAAIDQLLKEIQIDLATDMTELIDAIDYYNEWDKYTSMVLADTLTKQDYLSEHKFSLRAIGTLQYPLFAKVESFKLLQAYRDKIPDKYTDLMKELNLTYVGSKEQIETSQDQMTELLYKFKDFRFEQEDYIEMEKIGVKGNLSDKLIQFYLTDPTYRKFIYEYQSKNATQWFNAITQFDKMALCYLMIRNQLNDSTELPSEIFTTDPLFSAQEMKELVGSYQAEGRNSIYTLFEYNGLLALKNSQARDVYGEYYLMTKKSKDTLMSYAYPEALWMVDRNLDGQAKAIISINKNTSLVFHRVEE